MSTLQPLIDQVEADTHSHVKSTAEEPRMPEPAVSKPREWSQPHLQALNYLNNCALDGDEVSIARLREILDVPDIPAASPVAAPESDALLADPNYVHIKILRGEIALTKAQAIHIAGLPADIEERLASPVAGVSAEKNYHFSDQQVIDATVGTDYLRSRLSGALAHMTSGEKWSLYRAIAKLAQPSAEGDGWIAVTERLPDLDVDVLTYSQHGWGIHVGRQEVGPANRPIWCEHHIPAPREMPYVTHWRPLPAPPVAKEGRES